MEIGEKRLRAILDDYISRVVDFKMANKFGPDERVESPKITAIMLTTLRFRKINELFSSGGNKVLDNGPYPKMIRGTFFNRLVYACLGLSNNYVNTPIGQDFLSVLVTEDLGSEKLMSVLFKGIFEKDGDTKYCLED